MDFKCIQCEKSYRSKMALSNHKRLIHGNPKVHSCIQCEYTTKIKRDQDMHIRSVHEKIQEECMECGKKYSNIYNLKRHKRKHHMNLDKVGPKKQAYLDRQASWSWFGVAGRTR